jgi:hypothetical protein
VKNPGQITENARRACGDVMAAQCTAVLESNSAARAQRNSNLLISTEMRRAPRAPVGLTRHDARPRGRPTLCSW